MSQVTFSQPLDLFLEQLQILEISASDPGASLVVQSLTDGSLNVVNFQAGLGAASRVVASAANDNARGKEGGGMMQGNNAKLRPQDWRSGGRLWVVDIIAPFGGHDEMLKDLKQNVFPEQTIRYLGLDDGKPSVKKV